jgi:metallo-beta-lactamase family protein
MPRGPAIILAGSGMCTGGRIVDHLKKGHRRPQKRHPLRRLPGRRHARRAIQRYSQRPGGYVDLDGERKTIKAKVHTLSGYSAHADQKGTGRLD